MRAHLPSSFDDLVRQHYGGDGRGVLDSVSLDTLYASYYGQTSKPKGKKKRTTASMSLSVTTDDGEVLHQSGYVEYVVQQSTHDCDCCHEYVVQDRSQAASSAANANPAKAMCADDSTDDIDRVLAPSNGNLAAPTRTRDAAPPRPAALSVPEAPAALPPAEKPIEKPVDPSDEEFFKDLQDIISGNGKFNKDTRKVEPSRSAPPPPPAPNADNSQAIFDRIAQSMSYANAYDLGSVDLDNRFAEFDRMDDDRTKPKPKPSKKATDGPRPPVINTADFIEDMKDIADQARESATKMAESAMPTSQAQSVEYSRPFFDTGEHAQFGADNYVGALHVGPSPGVAFSYGQIIACGGDLFKSVEDMMKTSVADLTRIKSLVERSTRYYQGGKSDKSLDVRNEEWDSATHGMYLKLAENNYEHFSANYFFPSASFAKAVHSKGNNKSAWQAHHRHALNEARKLMGDKKVSSNDVVLEWPLIINAFGDHFLTDAFAAGHLVNKEEMIALFKDNFMNGSNLKPEADTFFEQVAKEAFVGEVAQKFSVLETANYPVCFWGICIPWHPNINSASRFKSLLVEAVKQQPDRIANFALKAIHDRLNRDGVEVTNGYGIAPYKVFGDGRADKTTLDNVRKAVQQSIDNLYDIAVSNDTDYNPYFEKVWKHVPVPTAASQAKIIQLAKEFTDPKSKSLIDAAAAIIRNEVNPMIKMLIDEKKLKPA